MAQLTGDNLVLMLRVRAAEDEAAAGKKEREDMRAALDEQRGPWFDEVIHLSLSGMAKKPRPCSIFFFETCSLVRCSLCMSHGFRLM